MKRKINFTLKSVFCFIVLLYRPMPRPRSIGPKMKTALAIEMGGGGGGFFASELCPCTRDENSTLYV